MRRFFGVVLLLVGSAFAAWIVLTSFASGSSIASWAPCPRNWAWLPAWLPRASPLAAVEMDFDGRYHAKVCYGRPSLRGRTMLGGEAVPFGSLWRTGANEATTLHLDTAARLGDVALLPGSYSIYTVPGPKFWQVIVNSSTAQWGLESEYTEAIAAREVGRILAAVEPLENPVETFTIRAVGAGAMGYELVFEWQTTRIRLPLTASLGEPD